MGVSGPEAGSTGVAFAGRLSSPMPAVLQLDGLWLSLKVFYLSSMRPDQPICWCGAAPVLKGETALLRAFSADP